MPNYTFKCTKCSLRFEKSLKLTDSSYQIKCIDCGENSLKMPPSGIGAKIAESKNIPKDIDLAVGRDSDKKWMQYEERKRMKDKVRSESGSEKLSIDLDGNYKPFSMTVDGKEVSGEEGVKYRKEMFNDYMKIKKDPETTKKIPSKEEMSKLG